MKVLYIFALVIISLTITASAMAADEFGDRFSQQAPAGLSDDPLQANEMAAQELQNIEPAAGDAVPGAADPEALADEADAEAGGNFAAPATSAAAPAPEKAPE